MAIFKNGDLETMKLIKNWKNVLFRSSSVKIMTLAGALLGVSEIIPDDLYNGVVQDGSPWAAIGLILAAILARLIKQESVSGKE